MKKRLLALGLAALILVLSGCSSLFKKEYLSVAAYTDEEHNEFFRNAKEVSTYAELKRVINAMVNTHAAEERLRFTDYDGAIHNDLSQAFREVEEETALGGYAVKNMYYDWLGRFVTYYGATVYINYKHTEEEIAAITSISGDKALRSFFDEALTSLKTSVAIRINSADLTEAFILSAVESAFNANPASCVLYPELTVTIHSSSTQDNIVEITFKYGATSNSISGMRQELVQAVLDASSKIMVQDDQAYAFEAYNLLAQMVSYEPSGGSKTAGSLETAINSSAYGALVKGASNSRGIALAYSALCREAEIECIVVSGTLDKVEHFWNMVKLNGEYYHVDISADSLVGVTGAFGRSDDQMRSNYWWNIEYPECPTSLNISEIYASDN